LSVRERASEHGPEALSVSAEAEAATPPDPPFARRGKEAPSSSSWRNNTCLSQDLSHPSQPCFFIGPSRDSPRVSMTGIVRLSPATRSLGKGNRHVSQDTEFVESHLTFATSRGDRRQHKSGLVRCIENVDRPTAVMAKRSVLKLQARSRPGPWARRPEMWKVAIRPISGDRALGLRGGTARADDRRGFRHLP
jgi:hypothetical protein